MPSSSWPAEIIVVRHGQSAGNVARDYAEKNGHASIEPSVRDMDVDLSDLGKGQASAFGPWFSQYKTSAEFNVFASPYVRTRETADLAFKLQESLKKFQTYHIDERLREREFGLITGLTRKGILEKYPMEVESYDRIKKFYYRPPGGESWCDVILRIRSFVEMLRRDYSGKRVLVFGHTVVVYAFRYVLENLSEHEILKIDSANEVANCSITTFVDGEDPKKMTLTSFNFVEHLKELVENITRKSDVPKI